MAESVVQFLLENLRALLNEEVSLLKGVRKEVKEIKKELDRMRALLRDADRRKDSNEEMKTWVGEVRDAAHDVEDIIDEFLHRMDRPRRGGFKGFLVDTIYIPKNISDRHQFARRLQETKVNVQNIFQRRPSQIEEVTRSSDVSEQWQRDVETTVFKADNDIVGMTKEIDLIDGWLVEEEKRRTVISVTGMGGVGKTTLVAKAYKNQQVKKLFDCYACVSVSQSLRIVELLRSIIKQLLEAKKEAVPNDFATKDAGDLRRIVRGLLESKKYLIILDDVWTMNDWNKLNVIFSDCGCGSRLVVTTRDFNVASSAGEGRRVCKLQLLDQEEAWVLFCKKAFPSEPCPLELEPLARSMVENCEGLPLAIIAMGGLLSLRDKTALEWNRIYKNLSWQLTNNQMLEPVKRILLLSFYDLPYRLKHCFLYCCMFPEDYLIHHNQLIWLWVAEGFVEETGKITMEEAAEDYLKELIHRNILQVVETNEFGKLKAYRMHDIVREVAISVSQEERFCMTYNELQAGQNGKVRRMSIHSSGEINNSSVGMTHLRSFMVFDGNMSFSSALNTMASSFRLLRVLNLRGIPIESIPDEVTNMFNLRYLNLRKTKVRELPESLWKLQNLQTLDVMNTELERLPSGIVKLRKLRHLFIYRITDKLYDDFDFIISIQVPIRICNLTNLQTLFFIEEKEGEVVKQVGNLTQLRSLGISKVREIDGAELCNSIGKMKHLLKLTVNATTEEETLQLEALSPNTPSLLQKLYLKGRLEKVPRWLNSLLNLTNLSLHWSKLGEEDPLSSIQALPNLMYLYLYRAYEGQQLCFRDGRFTKLRSLYLRDMNQLNHIVIEKGTLASIEEIILVNCGGLKTLPEGIEYLTGLQELRLVGMPMELTDKLKLKDGSEEDRRKVGHIPIIQRGQSTEAEGWLTERLN
ncbi:disease resistance protein RPM1-like [Magnolia sinica]|uniref:disease resistance protein RPM1-like n=1 Tax=Magnolia sinica TaxID=86752 RepID=UPI00265B23E9|nr:disease resistance protein RPM1-like [Magnolia sinica]